MGVCLYFVYMTRAPSGLGDQDDLDLYVASELKLHVAGASF